MAEWRFVGSPSPKLPEGYGAVVHEFFRPYFLLLLAFMLCLLAHSVARGGVPNRGASSACGRTRVPGHRCRRYTRRDRTIPALPPFLCCTAGPVRLESA